MLICCAIRGFPMNILLQNLIFVKYNEITLYILVIVLSLKNDVFQSESKIENDMQ